MEKAFYPRNDQANAVISNLLPRDGKEDILPDQNGDPIYLQRSSILDGTEIRGFGYCDGKPYKWKAEIESGLKSIVVVPDRFFSIYGKSYPIKRQQTVAINQASESYKYEIIYIRGYDKYEDSGYEAKIIYHRQQEQDLKPMVCSTDEEALDILNNFDDYPYLKLRVCMDGSIRAYLGRKEVGWDYTRQIDEEVGAAEENQYWVEIPQINTEQFRGIDLWVQFDGINALAYYIITKYEDNIFNIGPKEIIKGLSPRYGNKKEVGAYATVEVETDFDPIENPMPTLEFTIAAGSTILVNHRTPGDSGVVSTTEVETLEEDLTISSDSLEIDYSNLTKETVTLNSVQTEGDVIVELLRKYDISASSGTSSGGVTYYLNTLKPSSITTVTSTGPFTITELEVDVSPDSVRETAGKDYDLETPADLDESDPCTPCCKKSNLSRAIWAYINPRTMTPYDDDYWFHQGEPYYKKSLTLSTKNNPLKAQRIFVEQGTFPGMYKIVGETYIRNRDTGKDERVQLTFPLCKIKSDQTLTLQADGDPTTFNLDVEVAVPQNGVPMEITFYEVEKEMKAGCGDTMVEKDGSTRIIAG